MFSEGTAVDGVGIHTGILTDDSLTVLSVEEMLTREFPLRENILSPWLPTQGLAMIYSLRGTGKTHVALGIAVAVANGGEFLRWKAPIPRGVLYIDGEMPGVVMQDRLRKLMGGNETTIAPLYFITPDAQEGKILNLASRDGQTRLEPFLSDVQLVIVDNLSTLCQFGRENESESWAPIQEWALSLRRRGISVLFIHHANKSGGQRGNSKKEDILDTVINLKRPGDYRQDQGANFEVHFEKSRGAYGEEVKPFTAKLVTDFAGVECWEMKDLEDEMTQKVADLLNDGIPQREIHEMLGCAKGTVSKHKKKAAMSGLLSLN